MSVAWEQWSLDEFFLEPGSRKGYVDSVEVADDHVVRFCGADDIDGAADEFARSLGSNQEVYALLSGTAPPWSYKWRRPSFVRLLVFACWAQVTSLRREKEFRRLLTDRLGYEAPTKMPGVARMFERLREWLASEWDIDLRLSAGPYTQIGYALHVAFPTWRDLDALRKVRDRIRASHSTHSHAIVAAITQTGREETSLAFGARLEEWQKAIQTGDPFADDLAMAKAWRRVASEHAAADQLRVVEDEYGDLRLKTVDASNQERHLHALEAEAIERLAHNVARTARRGWVYLAPTGLGTWTSCDKLKAKSLLLSQEKLQAISAERPDVPRRPVGLTGWTLMAMDRRLIEIADDAPPAFVMQDGVSSGGALIGRWPLSPRFVAADPSELSLRLDDKPIATEGEGPTVSFARSSVLSGRVQVMRADRPVRRFRLTANAEEHPPSYLKTLEKGMADPEDGPLHDTEPRPLSFLAHAYDGPRTPPCLPLQALEEAIYARSARTISMQSFVGLAARAVEAGEDTPSLWDVMRAFVDAGQLEPCVAKKSAARLFLPREPRLRRAETRDGPLLVLDGLCCKNVRGRLRETARVMRLPAKEHAGVSEWSLPTFSVAAEVRAQAEFASRAGMPLYDGPSARSPPAERWSSIPDAIGYVATSAWSEETQRFEGGERSQSTARLLRMDRPAGDRPSIYQVVLGGRRELFVAPTIALLRLATSLPRTRAPFQRRGALLVRDGGRTHLPAAWGRWLRIRSLAAPGPTRTEGGWSYGYPIDQPSAEALAALCDIEDICKVPPWALRLAASRRADIPPFAAHGAIVVPSLGLLR